MKSINRIRELIKALDIPVSTFEKSIGASNNSIQVSLKRESAVKDETLNKILKVYPETNPIWLLTGKGSRLISNNPTLKKEIPLVKTLAIGGFGGERFEIQKKDIKSHYTIPKFNHLKIDFMIEVSGSSMYPKYNSGDIVACTIIKDSNFIQWNKVHVISTSIQGILIKRLDESNKENCIKAISDNESYKPFDIPKDEINGIALVVGVVRLE